MTLPQPDKQCRSNLLCSRALQHRLRWTCKLKFWSEASDRISRWSEHPFTNEILGFSLIIRLKRRVLPVRWEDRRVFDLFFSAVSTAKFFTFYIFIFAFQTSIIIISPSCIYLRDLWLFSCLSLVNKQFQNQRALRLSNRRTLFNHVMFLFIFK